MGVYVSTTPEQSVFVYGKFRSPANVFPPGPLSDLLGVASEEESIAVEILREFSPYEFIGKVLVRRGTEWRPLTPEAASARDWYKRFQSGVPLSFQIQGSGSWEIAWFRFESSIRDPNPYVAVALSQKVAEASNVARMQIVSQTGPVS